MKFYKDKDGKLETKFEYLDFLSMNELRAILYEAGETYHWTAKRDDLVKLIREKHLY